MAGKLGNWYRGCAFSGGLRGALFNPFFIARRGLRRYIAELGGALGGNVLDVGCGTKPYLPLIPHTRYVGMEYENAAPGHCADVIYDGRRFPFEAGEFDSVICNQVLEHIFEPDEFLSEIARVLRPGGRLLLTVPFVWDEHEQPVDFGRYSSFGLAAILERNGLRIIESRKTNAGPELIAQMWNAYLYKVLRRVKPISAQLFLLTLLTAPVNLLTPLLERLPRNRDLYLDNIILAERPEPSR